MPMRHLPQVLLHHHHLELSSADRRRIANEVLEAVIGSADYIQHPQESMSSSCGKWQDDQDGALERIH